MKILLIGATGLLGRQLWETRPQGIKVIPTFNTNKTLKASIKLDITNSINTHNIVKYYQPEIIIHTASIGNIDYCQKYQSKAWQVNVNGTKNLITAAKSNQAKLIFFSSNAVFDGTNPPYNEKSIPKPINFYGFTKVEAENLVKGFFPHATIFRSVTMYGWNDPKERQNPATWLIDRLLRHKKTPAVVDVFSNYLLVNNAANIVWKTIKLKLFGEIFHIAGKECVSRYDFAKKVVQVFQLDDNLLYPVSSDFFKHLTPRPKNTCLDISKVKNRLNFKPVDILSGLKIMKSKSLRN